ncbi:MAG: hypothetical protein HDS38_00145 [Bacteroides sp.]|nr:hypothetical protein [Bacteroides sp.]
MTKTKLIPLVLTLMAGGMVLDASARYRGDLNGDDRVDLADMVYLAKAIQSGSTDKALDVNASGSVDDYDLQRLADIIISGKLTEDSGMNVGIGGWEETGEDFGGTVKAPAFASRSAEETRFYMNSPRSEGDGRYSMEFGITEGNEAPAAIFFNIRLPREMQFDGVNAVTLDPAVSATHKLYGTPKFVKENEEDEWSEYSLRFIVLSPALNALPNETGKLGLISYSIGDCWGNPIFVNCQTASSNNGDCTDIPEHWSDYNGNFTPVEVSSVWFDQSEMNLVEGDENWISANIDPWDATDQNLVWTSSDESVATVSTEDGRNALIKAVKVGEVTISATSSNGVSASCKVRVVKRFVEIRGIYLNQDNLSITEGDSATLAATIDPADATDQTINWSSSDENIAVVSANGAEATVTALAPGYVEIYAFASNGMTATCCINVEVRLIDVTGVSLDQSELNLTEGDTAWLNATVSPDDATDKTLIWTSSDESVVRVSENGEVSAVSPGNATVTVTSSNGMTAFCSVTVTARVIAVTEVVLDNTSLEMTEGDTVSLTATVNPADATDKTLTWTSSDASVASVSENGEVQALKSGTATITVSSANGKTATCVVSVAKKIIEVTGITLSNTELKMTEGDAATLTATVNPSDATDKTLTWTSSDASVASVSANGEVQALKAGTATITVSSTNGKTATCVVTVELKVIEMQAIALDAEELSLEVGDTHQFIATVLPAEATYPELEWWIDDETVATVDQNGLLTMVGEGSTTVHVRSVRWPDIEATCRLNVTDAVDGIIADDAPCDIYTTNGKLLKQSVPASEIQNLDRGIYIIRQRGNTTKLLK